MPKIKATIQTRKKNYTSLQAVFRSENGAIDLASIMVGIIVIGLIGSVIAATVFAVIPWSQDNAAKQQLESIHTAENAFFGLSSDPTANLTGGKVNTFADSTALKTAALLTQAAGYCVVPSNNGQGYTGFVKSASGKIFYAQNSSKTPKTLTTGTLPCTSAGVYDTTNPPSGVDIAVAGGPTGGASTIPEATYTTAYAWDFENGTQSWSAQQVFGTISSSTAYKQAGARSLYVQGTSTNDDVGARVDITSSLAIGASYRATVWTYAPNATTTVVASQSNTSVSEAPVNGWVKTVITIPSVSSDSIRLVTNAHRGVNFTGTLTFYMDTVTLEKMNS